MHNTLYSILQSLPDAIVADANGALTAFELLERHPADVLVVDANIPLAERVALLARTKSHFPRVNCLVLTTTGRHHQLLKQAGADEVLLQNCSRQDIETAVTNGRFPQPE